MRSLVFGASAGLGRALARAFAARGHALVLLARDERDLEAEAKHLRTVHGTQVEWHAVDATDPAKVVQVLASLAREPPVSNLVFPLGMAFAGDDGALPLAATVALVNANLISVMATVGVFLPAMLAGNLGNVVGIGSVAALRGRSNNVAYAAAKRGLESYFESLRHRTAATGVRVQFYRLGYLDTQLTFGKRLPFPLASPQPVAERVARGLGRDLGCVTTPAYWRAVGVAVRCLPWPIFRRLKF
ncbi:MAG TPA: SDR family NAD(P)-dependent oxidoreductase [Stellaceae bacterium]|nr:SDR family NAD(P)-dependent oxidoreductase [Stellaceae bacterium]